MQKKRAWVLVTLLALTVVVLVISRSQSQALPSTYKGLALPTPRPVEGFTEALPPLVWLIVGDKAVIGTLAAGGTSRGHGDPAYALPDLPTASLPADARAVIVVGSQSFKSFKATVRPWSEDGRIVPLYDDTARELKAEVQREENLTVFTLEPTSDAGDQLLNVNITCPWGKKEPTHVFEHLDESNDPATDHNQRPCSLYNRHSATDADGRAYPDC